MSMPAGEHGKMWFGRYSGSVKSFTRWRQQVMSQLRKQLGDRCNKR